MRMQLFDGDRQVARYVYDDPQVGRPFFADVSVDGIQVTRNHPPGPDDDQDHPHHIGFFFSFGDLNGIDFWHMKGRCEHVRFDQLPQLRDGTIRFTVTDQYISPDDQHALLNQQTSYAVSSVDGGYRFEFDIRLQPVATDVHIGSKEEGGLAIRVATPLAVTSGKGGK